MSSTRSNMDDGRVEALADVLAANYIDSQYHYVQFLTEHLADCAAAFGGDLDSVLIMAVLGQRRLEIYREDPDGLQPEVTRMAMSVLRISDVSGIPRETVRRKLDGLRRKGWIDRHPRSGWYIAGNNLATPVRQQLADLEARSFHRLARLQLRLTEILARYPGTP